MLHGAQWDSRQVLVRNGRGKPFTLDKSGFALHADVRADHVDYYDEDAVVGVYYEDCERLLRRVTGAREVFAFDHNVRSDSGRDSGQRLRGGNLVQGAAAIVHGDYTATSAPKRLRQLTEPPKVNDSLRAKLGERPLITSRLAEAALEGGRRFAFVNVWRPISTVKCKPLACCDANTVTADDLLVFKIKYADRVGENYFARHQPQHAWYFFPAMTRDEVILLKQWDSHGDLGSDQQAGVVPPATFSLHSAFADPSSDPDAPDRESIEVRCVLIF